jgi:hypothetical protein
MDDFSPELKTITHTRRQRDRQDGSRMPFYEAVAITWPLSSECIVVTAPPASYCFCLSRMPRMLSRHNQAEMAKNLIEWL